MLALIACATTFNCSRAAGRYRSSDTSKGRATPLFNQFDSLTDVVLLPDPCRPAIRMTLGACHATFTLAVYSPSTSNSSSRTILLTYSHGDNAFINCSGAARYLHSFPTRRSSD